MTGKEEKKEHEAAKDVEIIVTSVETELLTGSNQAIKRMKFVSDVGDITWKPKITKSEYQGGIKVLQTLPMEIDLIPKKVHEIGTSCQEKGRCKVKATYQIWNTTQDGKPVTYRFIGSLKMFEKWEVLDDPATPVETVK